MIVFSSMASGGLQREILWCQALATPFAIELAKCRGQPGTSYSECEPRDLDVAGTDEFRECFFDYRLQEHRRPMFIQQQKLRIDPGLNRKLAQQPRAETVNRGDYSTVQGAFVIQPPLSLSAGCDLQNVIESLSQTLAHLVRGPIGERDGHDLIDVQQVLAQNVQVALDQHSRLARTRPGGHRDVLAELVGGGGLFRFEFARLFCC